MVRLAESTQPPSIEPKEAQPTHHHPVNGFTAENTLRDMQFRLAHNLQCSLDLNTTLELFFENVRDAVSLGGMRYAAPGTNTPHEWGRQQRHRASYTLSSPEQNLGKIEFSRARHFVESELAAIEMFLGVLYYPLRNALLYQAALHSSLRDALTGIGNRAAWNLAFSREVKLAERHKTDLSLLVMDVDHFKKINDTYGHQQGDKYLKHIADTLQSSIRETDQVFRYGGEEFVVLLNNTCAQDAALTAERIRLQVAMSPTHLDGQQVFASVSIGVAHLAEGEDEHRFFERADSAMYAAKKAGRNRVGCAS